MSCPQDQFPSTFPHHQQLHRAAKVANRSGQMTKVRVMQRQRERWVLKVEVELGGWSFLHFSSLRVLWPTCCTN